MSDISKINVGGTNYDLSARKWTTARTLSLTGSVTGSVSIDGTGNVSLATTTNHTHAFSDITGRGEALLSWGGQNFSGTYGPIDAAMVPELGANRAAFLPASAISVEYSRDGGTSWTDYGASNNDKINLFNGVGTSFSIGKNSSTGVNYTNYRLRVTISTAGVLYSVLNKFVVLISSSGSSGCWCSIDARLQSNVSAGVNTWQNFANQVGISGWSGYNVINTSGLTTYGNTASSQYGQVRFTFGNTGYSSSYPGLVVCKIFCFGGVGWTTPSTMAKTGHLYSYDASQNASFPARVSSSGFVKSSSSDSYVLLGGGGHKAVSDFATSASLGNYVLKAGDSMSGALTISANNFGNQLILNRGNDSGTWGPSIVFKNNGTFGASLGCDTSGVVYIGDNGSTKYPVWHKGNDGTGSGLDADLLDGTHKADLLTSASLSSSGNSTTLSVTVGGTTKTGSVTVPYASSAGSVAWSNVSNKPDTATRWPAWSEVTSKPSTFTPSAHNHAWSDITSDIPAYASRWPSWSEVTGKPSSYTPSSHTHSWFGDITGKITHGNEFNFSDVEQSSLWFNYRLADDTTSITPTTNYHFGQGKGTSSSNYAYLNAAGYKKNGSSDSYVLKGGGGHAQLPSSAGSTTQPVYWNGSAFVLANSYPTVNNKTLTFKSKNGSTTTDVASFTANSNSDVNVILEAGSNIILTPDATNKKITIAASGGGGYWADQQVNNTSSTTTTPTFGKLIVGTGSVGSNAAGCVAEGETTTASGNYSHAEGGNTEASGIYSHAEGNGTIASGNRSHAEGRDSKAIGSVSHAEGYFTVAASEDSHAEGCGVLAAGKYSHAEGDASVSGGFEKILLSGSSGTSVYNVSPNTTNIVANGYIILVSTGLTAKVISKTSSQVTLSNTLAYSNISGEEAYFSQCGAAFGQASHIEGESTFATGNYSHAEGDSTVAKGTSSHAEGCGTTAYGDYAHAEGYSTTASGSAHAEGEKTTASGVSSHAEGFFTTASGDCSHAEGFSTTATTQGAHSEGYCSTGVPTDLMANAKGAHAGGYACESKGKAPASENKVLANAFATFVHGTALDAENANDAMFGYGHLSLCAPKAEYIISTEDSMAARANAEWGPTLFCGAFSEWHTEGTDLILTLGEKQYVIANKEGIPAFIVGNGLDSSNKSNAFLVTYNGNAFLQGDMKSNSYLNWSDETMKNINSHIDPAECYRLIDNARYVKYHFKDKEGNDTGDEKIGLIAQDVNEVFPQVVDGEEGNMSLDYSRLVTICMCTIKDLNARVKELEAKIEKLENNKDN